MLVLVLECWTSQVLLKARSGVGGEKFYGTDLKCDQERIACVETTDGHDEVTKSTRLNARSEVVFELKGAFYKTLYTL